MKYVVYILPLIVVFVFSSVVMFAEASSLPNNQYCTSEYAPVCGQPPVNCPYGAYCTQVVLAPRTYSNTCVLQKGGARFLYWGVCRESDNPYPPINKPPTISSFSGPTVLNVNQLGTWSIAARDPENGQLSYDINWGDEPVYAYAAQSAQRQSFTQGTSFQHSYASAGTYTVTIAVRDNAGKSVRSSTTVRIDEQYYPPQPPQPQPWPYYYNYYDYYNNYYDNYYYDNYYYNWNWQNQNPYGWSNWNWTY